MRPANFFLLAMLALFSPGAGAADRVTYFVPDAQGSPAAAMDEQGNLLWRETYAPYGERKTKAPANNARPAYTGKPEDPDTGLVYMGARMYDPETARFTGIDPQWFKEDNPQSFGRYVYANNSPYVYVDPTGEVGVPAAAVTALVVTGYVARDMATSAALGAAGVPDVPFSISKLSTAIARKASGDIISGPTIFWAGGAAARDAAKKLADDIGGKTLDMTVQGQKALRETAGKAYAETRETWAAASRQLADEASSVAHVVLNHPAVKKTSILLTDEIPAALKNQKVTGFLFHEVKKSAD